MGAVTFGIPETLATTLVRECNLKAAVETGTYLGGTTRFLRSLVPNVWSIEVLPEIHAKAEANLADLDGLHLHLGPSEKVLASIADQVSVPALFWLDGHGGTFGGSDVPEGVRECPVAEELAAIARFPASADSCILIDDARGFLGPVPHHRRDEWPPFVEVADLLRQAVDRYVTILDDVIIAVPAAARRFVDDWWLDKLMSQGGRDAYSLAADPTPSRAARQLVRSLAPNSALKAWRTVRMMQR